MQNESYPRRFAMNKLTRRGSQQAGRSACAKGNQGQSLCGLQMEISKELWFFLPKPVKALLVQVLERYRPATGLNYTLNNMSLGSILPSLVTLIGARVL